MSIWFFLWILLSLTLLFFAGWTFFLMYRQKESWRAFAKKYKLRYTAKKNFMAPEVSGVIDGFTVTLFTSEHMAADRRGARKMSAIEINLKSRLSFLGAAGSGMMVPIIESLAYKGEIKPTIAGWQSGHIIRSSNSAAMEAYLTQERLEALVSLMKGKAVSIIFIFEENETLLRLDTPDPLETTEKIEKTVKRLVSAAKSLELKDNEGQKLSLISEKSASAPIKLEVPDEINIQLED